MTDMHRPFCATSVDENGIVYSHTFWAPTMDEAIAITEKNGWTYDGELVYEEVVTDEELDFIVSSLECEGEIH